MSTGAAFGSPHGRVCHVCSSAVRRRHGHGRWWTSGRRAARMPACLWEGGSHHSTGRPLLRPELLPERAECRGPEAALRQVREVGTGDPGRVLPPPPEIRTTSAPGSAPISSAASSPPIVGIRTSMRTSSGRSVRVSSTASSLVAAVPASSKPGLSSMTCRATVRKAGLSSATSTRMTAPAEAGSPDRCQGAGRPLACASKTRVATG